MEPVKQSVKWELPGLQAHGTCILHKDRKLLLQGQLQLRFRVFISFSGLDLAFTT